MLKPLSTKRPRPIPAEFEREFVAGGWDHVNQMFGKRPALRFYHAMGGNRLSAARLAAVRYNKRKA